MRGIEIVRFTKRFCSTHFICILRILCVVSLASNAFGFCVLAPGTMQCNKCDCIRFRAQSTWARILLVGLVAPCSRSYNVISIWMHDISQNALRTHTNKALTRTSPIQDIAAWHSCWIVSPSQPYKRRISHFVSTIYWNLIACHIIKFLFSWSRCWSDSGDSQQRLPNWFTCTTCELSFVCCENILTKSIFYSWHSGCARIRILMLCALFLSHLPSLSGIVCGFGWPYEQWKMWPCIPFPLTNFQASTVGKFIFVEAAVYWEEYVFYAPIPNFSY